ncbi:MFS transporter [Halopseudomonas phragmitis]|uniref:MFS transporter n=1 Tax=Halopseudomonas phragmitis TaxID=1931241 RepID=A0A1V0B158_9GAMM|nr:MFS transporter [Halopseudomonas phragmitis]AQZ93666.1 hypothetical protein BVH74_02330 [Halopseudomonas phragmitis]
MTNVTCTAPAANDPANRIGTRLAYGLPGLPLAMLGVPLYVYLPPFYAAQVGLGLAAVGTALMLTRLFDVLSDPLIGYLADRLPAAYRRRLMMLIGTPLLLFALHRLLLPPPAIGLAYLYGWALLAYLGWTMVTLPYQAWGAEATLNSHGRTRLATSREGFAIVGIVLAAALPLLIGSEDPARVLAAVAMLVLVLLPLAVLLLFWRVPETGKPQPAQSWRTGLRLIRSQLALRTLLGAHFLNSLANGLPAALFILFVSHRLQVESALGPLLLLYFGAGVIALPGWSLLARHLGKRLAWLASVLLAASAFVVVPWLGPGDLLAFALVCLISGLSLGADLALPASILGDLADEQSHTGLLFGLLGLVGKLALAIAVGLGFGLLELSGFQGADTDSTGMLALLYGGVPVALKLLGGWLIWSPLGRHYRPAALTSAAAEPLPQSRQPLP